MESNGRKREAGGPEGRDNGGSVGIPLSQRDSVDQRNNVILFL